MSLEDLLAVWAGGKPWAAQIDETSRSRDEALRELTRLIAAFEAGELDIASFSTSLDRFSKRTNLWGFRGRSGQMFLNVLMRAGDHARLEDDLREAIGVPADEQDAERRIDSFSAFVAETQSRAARLNRLHARRASSFILELPQKRLQKGASSGRISGSSHHDP